ncbi:MFS transporter, partial [Bdellovibrionota bacterium FG-2]
MQSKRLIRLFYQFQFFFSLLFWVPIFYEFQKRSGLTDPEIFGIQSVYYLAFCMFEFPTGFFADRVGYLASLRLGSILGVAANALPIFAPNVAGFFTHFLLIALSRSLISGAASAYLYVGLAILGDPLAYKGAEGRARAYGLVGKVVGWSVVGYLMKWYLPLPYVLTTLSSGVAVYFAWALPELRGPRAVAERVTFSGAFQGLIRMARADVLSPRWVGLVMLQGVSIFVLTRIVQVNLFQPILGERGFGLESYGWIMAFTSVFEALGSAWPGGLRRLFSDLSAVFVLTVAMSVCVCGIGFSGPWGAVMALSVFALLTGVSFPIQRQLMNDVIPREGGYRATILSIESLVDRAVCAGVAVLLGGFVARGQTNLFLHVSAGVSLLVCGGCGVWWVW